MITVSRRDFLRLAGAATAGAALAACAPAAPPAAAPAAAESAPQKSEEPITVRYGYYHTEADMLGLNQKKLLEKNNYTVPGTNVKVELLLGYETDRAMADLAAGTAADVFWAGYGANIIEAIHEGLMVCAEDMMHSAGFDFSNFVDGLEAIYKPTILDSKMWGVPYEQVVVVWAYNPKVFKDAGVEPPKKDWTWQDAIDVGLQVTKDKAGKHPNEPGFNINEVDVWALGPWQAWGIQEYLPYTAGGSYIDKTGTKATINTDAFYETLQWLRDIYQKHQVATAKQPEKGLFTGKLAIQETGNWALIDFSKNMEEVGCLYCPVHPVQKVNATPWYDKELWIPAQKDGAKVEAAYKFASWWAFDAYLDFAIETGYFPFLKSDFKNPKWINVVKDKPYMQVAMEMPAFAKPRFWSLFPGAAEAEKTLSELWDTAVYTQDDIKAAMAKAEAEVQRIMDKNKAS